MSRPTKRMSALFRRLFYKRRRCPMCSSRMLHASYPLWPEASRDEEDIRETWTCVQCAHVIHRFESGKVEHCYAWRVSFSEQEHFAGKPARQQVRDKIKAVFSRQPEAVS